MHQCPAKPQLLVDIMSPAALLRVCKGTNSGTPGAAGGSGVVMSADICRAVTASLMRSAPAPARPWGEAEGALTELAGGDSAGSCQLGGAAVGRPVLMPPELPLGSLCGVWSVASAPCDSQAAPLNGQEEGQAVLLQVGTGDAQEEGAVGTSLVCLHASCLWEVNGMPVPALKNPKRNQPPLPPPRAACRTRPQSHCCCPGTSTWPSATRC